MSPQNKSSQTSLMLIASLADDQLKQLYLYLSSTQLTKISLKQFKRGNLPNLHLYNQDGKGLKIEDVRKIIEISSFGSYNSQPRIFAILHAHQSSIPAQNALLKIIILVTAYPKQLLPTIHSRCQKIFTNQITLKPNVQKSGQNTQLSATKNNLTEGKLNNIKHDEEIMKIAQMILNSRQFTYAQAIDLTSKFKKREETLALVVDLINYLHQQLSSADEDKRKRIVLVLKELMKSHQHLLKNLNPSLTLEHHLFNVVDS